MKSNKPSVLELAEMITRYNVGVCSQKIYEDYEDAADMLRKQHEVILKLREALGSVMQYNEGQPEWIDALRTLIDTKEFNHD